MQQQNHCILSWKTGIVSYIIEAQSFMFCIVICLNPERHADGLFQLITVGKWVKINHINIPVLKEQLIN